MDELKPDEDNEGCGKAMVLRAIAAESRGTVYVSDDTVTKTPRELIEAIGKAMIDTRD